MLVVALVGCGDDANSIPDARPDGPPQTLGPPPELAMACSDSPADVYVRPASLGTMTDANRGDVFRCAPGESLSTIKVSSQIDAYNAGYQGIVPGKATSGFWTFRIAYRSMRNTVNAARAEGDMAAFLLVPEKPLAGAPLIVFGHGSVGFAAKCAPSRLDLLELAQDQDYPPMLLRLAGAGYTVIAPDYSGFSYDQAPGYFNAEDEAHAVLDATRAAAKILKSPPSKVAFVGHSQGGHAVIAAQTYAESYGMQGELVGVATLAPFWTSLTLFAAATTPAAGLTTTADVSSILYAMAYGYSAGELRDGTGLDVFATAKQAAARDALFSGECYDGAKLQALGGTPAEFFEPAYVETVGGTCAIGGDCTATLAADWKTRWQEDRPALDPTGAPVLAIYGGQDTFITPSRAQCGRNKLASDIAANGSTTTVQNCYSASAGHRDIVRTADADYVIAWIANQAGIGPEPAPCTEVPSGTLCGTIPNDF